jgi:hypothetical protein
MLLVVVELERTTMPIQFLAATKKLSTPSRSKTVLMGPSPPWDTLSMLTVVQAVVLTMLALQTGVFL